MKKQLDSIIFWLMLMVFLLVVESCLINSRLTDIANAIRPPPETPSLKENMSKFLDSMDSLYIKKVVK